MPNKAGNCRVEQVESYLEAHHLDRIGLSEWRQLRADFPELSENSLRNRLGGLFDTGRVPVDAAFRPVRQKTLEELENCLLDLADFYKLQEANGARLCRKLVVQAKDKAKFAARNPRVDTAKRGLKKEMAEWMLVWLSDPRIFADWVTLRKRKIAGSNELPDLTE